MINPAEDHSLRCRLLRPLRALAKPQASRHRSVSGDVIDLDALVQWRVDRCLAAASRAACGVMGGFARAVVDDVRLLVDRSASTGQPLHPAGHSPPQGAVLSASGLAGALRDLGLSCAVVAFNSHGRHAVLRAAGCAAAAGCAPGRPRRPG